MRPRLVRAEVGSHIFDIFVCSPVQERDCSDVCSLTRLLPITNSNVEQLPFPVIALSTRSAVTHHHRCPYGVGRPLPTIYLSGSQTMSFCLVAVLPDSHVTYADVDGLVFSVQFGCSPLFDMGTSTLRTANNHTILVRRRRRQTDRTGHFDADNVGEMG